MTTFPHRHFFQGLRRIVYLGKGTHTDCALRRTSEEMQLSTSVPKPHRFAVVITDGHVTANPCGGIKMTAEEARDKGIRIFVVAASTNIEKTGLIDIASSPASVFRDDFMAVDFSQGKATIDTSTMDRIIKSMVTHKHTHRWNIALTPCSCLFFFLSSQKHLAFVEVRPKH